MKRSVKVAKPSSRGVEVEYRVSLSEESARLLDTVLEATDGEGDDGNGGVYLGGGLYYYAN